MNSPPAAVDELIEARWVVPVEPHGAVLEHHAIAIRDGRIAALVPTAEARMRYAPAKRTILAHHAVVPGLINAHTHAAMTLMRGIADDRCLMDWLQGSIWPIEKAELSYKFVLDGTRLACLEMLRGGTTCFADMYFFLDAAAQAASEVGIRANLGITVIDFPTAWASDLEDYLQKGLALRDQLKDEPLLSFCFAPHAPYTISDSGFERIALLSEQVGLPLQVHLHETVGEIDLGMAQHGCRPIARLERLGLVGPQLTAVHAVHLDSREIALFARNGVSIAHCPTSNLKLASGIAPIAACLEAGVRVAIGTDGAASNNRLDMPGEMRLAALLAKGSSGRAEAFPVHAVLRAATLSAAEALCLDQRIGSIVAGKEADLVAFDYSFLEAQPCFDPVSHLIFVMCRENVSDVWVRGEAVVEKRRFVNDTARNIEAFGATTLALWQNRIGRAYR